MHWDRKQISSRRWLKVVENWKRLLKRHGISARGKEKALELDNSDGCTIWRIHLSSPNHTLYISFNGTLYVMCILSQYKKNANQKTRN